MNAPSGSSNEEGAGLAQARVAIIGCGAVGRALARSLWGSGIPLVLASRTRARADELAASLGPSPNVGVEQGAHGAAAGADLVLLSVGDDALNDVVESIIDAGPRAVLHTNGTRGLGVLKPLAAAGWATGKAHPLVAVPAASTVATPFRGAWFATLGSPDCAPWIERLLGVLGARSLPLSANPGASRSMHAAASLASGGLVALVAAALEATKDATRDREATAQALISLMAGTLQNVATLSPSAALAGPIARGSVELVREHLDALAHTPHAAAAYRLLGRQALDLADLPAATRATLSRLLD